MSVIAKKFKENSIAILLIIALVLLMHIFVMPMSLNYWIRFIIGAVLVIIGLSLFLVGVDVGISPFGSFVGDKITKTKKLYIFILTGVLLGFLISIAEPGLLILASQVDFITEQTITRIEIIMFVSIGLAIMFAVGFLRILYNWRLYKILLILYLLIFIGALFTPDTYLAIAFDTSGATTGILAVPFILALSVGISHMKKDSKQSEKDSFGLVAIASTGPIFAIIILSIIRKGNLEGNVLSHTVEEATLFVEFFQLLKDAILAIGPLFLVFLVSNWKLLKLTKKQKRRIIKGFIYAFLGLILFFLGIQYGFMNVATTIGSKLIESNKTFWLLFFGLMLGILTMIAEPAVNVLTHQIEEVTSGSIKRFIVLIGLSAGSGIAILLSLLRILIDGFSLWYILFPGYLIALVLMFFAPKLFVGIAFDAGGVATGPITTTFVLAFIYGAAESYGSTSVVLETFGMIALVALMPIITLQIIGIMYKYQSKKGGVDHE